MVVLEGHDAGGMALNRHIPDSIQSVTALTRLASPERSARAQPAMGRGQEGHDAIMYRMMRWQLEDDNRMICMITLQSDGTFTPTYNTDLGALFV